MQRFSVAAALLSFSFLIIMHPSHLRAASPSGEPGVTSLVSLQDGIIQYAPYDAEGDRLPDFSTVGYEGGGVPFPAIGIQITLTPDPASADEGPRIQKALDKIADMPVGANGYRGALLLKAGKWPIKGTLEMRASGVVLRGEGDDASGTVLLATGDAQHDLIHVAGQGEMRLEKAVPIVDDYVPVGATTLHVSNASEFKRGDTVIVTRPSTAAWIHFIKMDQIGEGKARPGTKQWQPGEYDLHFDRVVTAVEGNAVSLDAPIVNPLQKEFGTSTVARYHFPGRIEHVGIENLRGDSSFASPEDENHGWNFISVTKAQNVFIRKVTARHFGYSCVTFAGGAKWCTIEDSACIDAISKITGGRRYSFGIQGGTLCLVQRCSARDGRHDFVLGARTTGPNAFVDCIATLSHADIGPHHRWSCGCLFDNVQTTGAIDVEDRQASGSGHGWAGAQMVFWNCKASTMVCQHPPTGQNFAIGCTIGNLAKGHWADHLNGWIESKDHAVAPPSLFQAQLAERFPSSGKRP